MDKSSFTMPQHLSQYTLLMISGSPTSSGDERGETKPEVLNGQRSHPARPLRCVKRTTLATLDLDFPHRQHFVASVARRNERERNRVRLVNAGFQTLRQHVPNGATNGNLSKVETLRSAVEYIRALRQLLDDNEAISEAFQNSGVPSPSVSSALSMGPESPHSTCSSSSEDRTSYGHVSSEEPELLDFTTWLHRYTDFLNI